MAGLAKVADTRRGYKHRSTRDPARSRIRLLLDVTILNEDGDEDAQQHEERRQAQDIRAGIHTEEHHRRQKAQQGRGDRHGAAWRLSPHN